MFFQQENPKNQIIIDTLVKNNSSLNPDIKLSNKDNLKLSQNRETSSEIKKEYNFNHF